jgi:putative membrane protein
MLKQLVLACALILSAGPTMAQKTTAPPKAAKATAAFVKNATIGSAFAADASRLAAQKAQNPEVKTFAQNMADEATKKSDELKQIVQQAGMPAIEPVLDARRAAVMKRLQALPAGTKFDRAYIDAQGTTLNRAISALRTYSRSGDNAQLKQFATNTLPTLQDNLKQIKGLKAVKTSRAEKKS